MLKRFKLSKLSIKDNDNILDIGAGYGEILENFQKNKIKINYFALEQEIRAQKKILKIGGNIIDSNINNFWSKEYKSYFNIIIFRHTLEHLDNIDDILKQLSASLKNNGLAYIVVPNAMHKSIRYIKTDFCRPVHLSYFNIFSLNKLLNKNNLKPLNFDYKDTEIWTICKLQEKIISNKKDEVEGLNNSIRQKKHYLSKINTYYYLELWKIIKIYIKRLLIKNKIIKY